MIITWHHNESFVRIVDVRTDKSTTLVIEDPEPSDAGHYQCVFKDLANNGWTLRRNIRLFITSMYFCATK